MNLEKRKSTGSSEKQEKFSVGITDYCRQDNWEDFRKAKDYSVPQNTDILGSRPKLIV